MAVSREQLSGPADRAATSFGAVAALLADVRAATGVLCDRLRALDRVLVDQGGNARLLDRIDSETQSILDVVRAAAARASDGGTMTAVGAATSCLGQISASARAMEAVASLTKVTARSLGLSSFDDYVGSVRRFVAVMHGDADRLSSSVADLGSHRLRAGQLFGRAEADLRSVTHLFDDIAAQRERTERLLLKSMEVGASLALRLPSDTAAEMEVLIRAIQFSDAMAQRLDHVGMVLSHADGSPHSRGALARALLTALVDETGDIADAALTSLARIGQLADGVGRVLGHDSESPAIQAIRMGRETLAKITAVTHPVLVVIGEAEEESDALCRTAQDAMRHLSSLISASEDMQIHAVNAALLAKRVETAQGVMDTLSVEVRQNALTIARQARACATAMAELSRPADLAAFGAVPIAAAAYRDAIGQTEAAVDAAELAARDVLRMHDANAQALRQLSQVIQDAKGAFQAIYSSTDDLMALAKGLPNDVEPTSDPLLHLMDIYSMEAERIVHRRVFGLPEVPPPPPATVEAQDDLLAAVLF